MEYTLTSPELVLVGDKPSEVRLHLAGPRNNLDGLIPSQFSVKIDLSNAVPGKQSFLITEANLRLPKKIRLLDVTPPNVELTLAEIVKRELAIKPQLVGRLPAIQAKGQVTSLTTTPIYLETIRDTTTLFCKIIAPPAIQPLDRRWPDMEVTVEVKPKK